MFIFSFVATIEEINQSLKNNERHFGNVKGLKGVDLELAIASQTNELVRVKKHLATILNESSIKQILESNGSSTDGDYISLLNRCADFLTFGAIEKCGICHDEMIFTKHGYSCNGVRSEWVPCLNFKKNPNRFLCQIPQNLSEEKFLATCNLFVANRAVRENKKVQIDFEAILHNFHSKTIDHGRHLILKESNTMRENKHVYKYKGNVFSCFLIYVDVQDDKNSFFSMEILQSNKETKNFWLFTISGRLGTTIRKQEKTFFKSAIEVCTKFEEIFNLKTGNDWCSKKRFEKHPGKFFFSKIECPNLFEVISIPTNLLPKVVDLMKILFNKKFMKFGTTEIKLVAEMTLLGKLSLSEIKRAEDILTALENAINENRQDLIIGFTNQFLSLIPHCFDLASMPILDSLQKINKKRQGLKTLTRMQNANDKKIHSLTDQNSFEAHYLKLNSEILPIDPQSPGYMLIMTYAKNTAPNIKIKMAEIYKVNRNGEKVRFEKFKNFSNRMFLWHGSNIQNFASIFTNGLIVTKAGTNARMFGDGIYFAEMLCKALNFCVPDANGFSYLVLCEVALGKMKEYKSQCYANPLPAGFDSVKGIGKIHPNPKEAYTRKDGVVIPLGRPVSTNQTFGGNSFPLNYNEYVVYNKDQINIQYLVKLEIG